MLWFIFEKEYSGCCVKNNTGRGKNRRLKGCSSVFTGRLLICTQMVAVRRNTVDEFEVYF